MTKVVSFLATVSLSLTAILSLVGCQSPSLTSAVTLSPSTEPALSPTSTPPSTTPTIQPAPTTTTPPASVPTSISPLPTTTVAVGIQVGNRAPNFQLQNLAGETVSLESLRGKPVLINFWATWCGPCKIEMPYLQQIYDVWSPKGLVILAIDVGESSAVAGKFLADNNLSLPVLLDTDRKVTTSYGITAIPTTFFIDKNGIIAQKFIGAFPNKEAIEVRLSRIIP